ncbi:MAG: glycerol-3-phosphate acyltransferase [Candidatus Paceibacterales bacterium]
MVLNFLYIILGYLLGSLPFGYIITKLSTKKNILEIGWRKTSGSNVFKNIGIWQGALTGILDAGKGFLAVGLAQNQGLPIQIQALAGAAAVTGHNWSCFLKFAGGRGIGTFVGAFLVLSPKILGFSIIPLILLALIWNASIGTIFFLITAIVLSVYFNQFETAGLLTLASLAPIFIKRLSPIEEILPARAFGSGRWQAGKKAQDRTVLIRNRLIFDDDKPRLDLRIKRVIGRLTKK